MEAEERKKERGRERCQSLVRQDDRNSDRERLRSRSSLKTIFTAIHLRGCDKITARDSRTVTIDYNGIYTWNRNIIRIDHAREC